MIHTIKTYSSKKHISFVLFSLINILFAVKYFSRYTSYYVCMVVILCIFHTLLFYKGKKLLQFIRRKDTFIGILWLVCFCIGCIFVWDKIPVESLNVDRWSVITSFWDQYFSGQMYITPSLIWEIIRAQCLFILSWHSPFTSSENWDFFRLQESLFFMD